MITVVPKSFPINPRVEIYGNMGRKGILNPKSKGDKQNPFILCGMKSDDYNSLVAGVKLDTPKNIWKTYPNLTPDLRNKLMHTVRDLADVFLEANKMYQVVKYYFGVEIHEQIRSLSSESATFNQQRLKDAQLACSQTRSHVNEQVRPVQDVEAFITGSYTLQHRNKVTTITPVQNAEDAVPVEVVVPKGKKNKSKSAATPPVDPSIDTQTDLFFHRVGYMFKVNRDVRETSHPLRDREAVLADLINLDQEIERRMLGGAPLQDEFLRVLCLMLVVDMNVTKEALDTALTAATRHILHTLIALLRGLVRVSKDYPDLEIQLGRGSQIGVTIPDWNELGTFSLVKDRQPGKVLSARKINLIHGLLLKLGAVAPPVRGRLEVPDPDNDSDVDSGDDEGGGSEGGSNASSSAEDLQNDEVPEVQDEDQEGGAGDDDAAPALANGAADTVAVALEEALPAVFLDQANAEPAEVVADVEEPLAPASNESVAVPTVSPPVSATISPPLAPNVVTKSAPRASMRVQTLPLTFPNTAPPVSAPSTSVLAELAAMVMSPDRPSTSAGWSDVESPVKLKSRGGSGQRSVMVRAARANATKVDDTLTENVWGVAQKKKYQDWLRKDTGGEFESDICQCPDVEGRCGPSSNCSKRPDSVRIVCAASCALANYGCGNQFSRQLTTAQYAMRKTKRGDYGLFATASIDKDVFIGEYVGEIKPYAKVLDRLKTARGRNDYLMSIDGNWTIDSGRKGNTMRYMNHRCRTANCRVIPRIKDNLPIMVVLSERRIEAGEELTYTYGYHVVDDGDGFVCSCDDDNCLKGGAMKLMANGSKKNKKQRTE